MSLKNKEELKKMKRCSKCGIEMDESQFNKNATKKDGFEPNCKDCRKKYREENKTEILEQKKKYYGENKTEILEQRKKYYEENKTEILEQKKKYYEENKTEISEQRKKYYGENKTEILERWKKYYEENKTEISERWKKYYEENKTEILEQRKKYREENPNNRSIKERIWRFKNKYGISVAPDYYPDKLAEQDNKCALCSTPQFKLKNSLSLDHDHRKNTLRGLLCSDCNINLGHMERRKINGLWFINALDYLIQYNSIDPQIYKNELIELQKRLWIFVNENYKINQLTGDLVNE